MSQPIVRVIAVVTMAALLSSCALLPTFGTKPKSREQVYTLDPAAFAAPDQSTSCGSVALGDSMAAPGFRTSRMAYSTAPYEIDYYAYARWADSIARLLRRPLQRGFEAHGGFDEVLTAPTIAPTSLRVELSDVSLIQRFDDRTSERSTVELGASLRVFALNPNEVLATTEYRLTRPANGTPSDGVVAANELVAQLVQDVVTFTYSTCTSSP